MWSCSPSTFNPAVGPNVESLAGLPESPNAPAVPMTAISAIALNHISSPNGINKLAMITTMLENEHRIAAKTLLK